MSSGLGKTSGRGMNGQMSRSGSTRRAWFEGGQMPLQRRVPKRGFNNYTRKNFQIVNLSTLNEIGMDTVTPEILKEKKAINSSKRLIKILGKGEITRPVNITADAFSKTAIEKLKNPGGNAVVRELTV